MSTDPLVINPVLRVTPEPMSPTGSFGGKARGKLSDPLKAATRKILITYNGQNYEIELFSNKSSLNEQILEHSDHLKSLTPLIEKICDYLQKKRCF